MDEGNTSRFLDRAQRYHKAIAEVLLRDWDPIGIADVPEAQDEYDSYVGPVYGLLISRSALTKIVEYLWWAETEHMGLTGSRTRTEHIARRLLQVRDELEHP